MQSTLPVQNDLKARWMAGGVVAVTSLALEARVARGRGVRVICSHGARLGPAIEMAMECGVSGIISFGVAGGLAPGLAAGDWIVAATVRTGQQRFATDLQWTRNLLDRLPGAMHADILGTDTLVSDPLTKKSLYAQTGAAAVDMESHIVARIAAAHRVPFVVCRAIIDAADTPLPPLALVALRDDGTTDVAAVLRSVLKEPAQLPALVRIARATSIARTALRRGCVILGPAMGFLHFRDALAETRFTPRVGSEMLSGLNPRYDPT